jgi:hypothetical protein
MILSVGRGVAMPEPGSSPTVAVFGTLPLPRTATTELAGTFRMRRARWFGSREASAIQSAAYRRIARPADDSPPNHDLSCSAQTTRSWSA